MIYLVQDGILYEMAERKFEKFLEYAAIGTAPPLKEFCSEIGPAMDISNAKLSE